MTLQDSTDQPELALTEIQEDLLSRGRIAALAHNLALTPHDQLNRNTQIWFSDGSCWLLKEPEIDFRTGKLRCGVAREGWFYGRVWSSELVKHLQVCIPELIHYDEEQQFLFLKYLEGYETLQDYHRRIGRYPINIAWRVAETLALIHFDSFAYSDKYSDFRSRSEHEAMNVPGMRITPEILAGLPDDGVNLVKMMQSYPEMVVSIQRLRDNWQPLCLVHKDIKWDNLLIPLQPSARRKSGLVLIDWESWDWGDPAWDVGAALGGYVKVWLSSLDWSRNRPLEELFATAKVPLERVQPAMHALWARYKSLCKCFLQQRPHFHLLVIQYAGIFLMTRLWATLMEQRYLSVANLYILPVAKNLLIHPEQYVHTILGHNPVYT